MNLLINFVCGRTQHSNHCCSTFQQIDGYTAGVDYPNYSEVPKGGSFSCQNRIPGYYADMETRCQVWHWCLHSGTMFSFLCSNGTVFDQVCIFILHGSLY